MLLTTCSVALGVWVQDITDVLHLVPIWVLQEGGIGMCDWNRLTNFSYGHELQFAHSVRTSML